jgi:phenylacetate-coenzyme A ligase PaaK-like adenylate-forming protein
MTLVGSLREARLTPDISARAQDYTEASDGVARRDLQLQRWNEEWRRIVRDVPYYINLKKALKLPDSFRSWEEFADLLPVTTRSTVQEHRQVMASRSRSADFYRITGGSTAQPIQLPAWSAELHQAKFDLWMARRWYGIGPASRLFLLWGHSHLLGNGLRGWVNARKRGLLDSLLGYYRYSAYNLSFESMRAAARALIKVRPDYLVGYSVALDAFARINQDLKREMRELKLKAVIGAAEGFPSQDSQNLLVELFGCPLGMEYGSVETNLVAHTHPFGNYRVFWRTYFVEAGDAESKCGGLRVRVTSLYPRCCPLVRYELGDEIELCAEHRCNSLGIERFKRIIGRVNDFVTLDDGTSIHSEAFTHAIRWSDEVKAYQVVQNGSNIALCVLSNRSISTATENTIRSMLAKIHPTLGSIKIEQVGRLEQTLAGKTRMVVVNQRC